MPLLKRTNGKPLLAACALAFVMAFSVDYAVAGPTDGLTSRQASARAQAKFGGRVLSAKRLPMNHPGAPAYRIKLLKNGKVRAVIIRSDGK